MPKIPLPTAQNNPGVLNLPTPTAEDFGAGIGSGMVKLSDGLFRLDAHLQDQRDKLALTRMTTDFDAELSSAAEEIAKNPDLTTHQDDLQHAANELQAKYRDQATSSAVRTAFLSHTYTSYDQAKTDLAIAGRKMQAQRAIADFTDTQHTLTQKAALATTPEEASKSLQLLNDLRANMQRNGLLTPQDVQKSKEAAQDRYWNLVAQHDPNRVLDLQQDVEKAMASGEGGASIPGMDQEKLHSYVSLAVSTLNAQQLRDDRAIKAQEAQIKAVQAQNANLLTADALEGKQVSDKIPGLLRSRALDDGVARTLVELETKIRTAPDMTKYQPGLAAQIEASLTAMKYSPEALQDGLEQGLVSDFNQGRILKDEFTHLMSVYRGVEDHKSTAGKESQNQEVTRAHSNLVGRLRTTGPADKFDALSEQTIKEAEQFFYRRMNQQPDADPWKVMQESEAIFKPVIEKRLGLSKNDTSILDDARMKALRQSGAISAAAYKAYQERSQQERGWQAVQEALQALPPPPQPGFFDRLFKKPEQSAKPAPRKKSPIFGE